LPHATALPVFEMAAVAVLASHLIDTAQRYEYLSDFHG
jgi:hypothetical protein